MCLKVVALSLNRAFFLNGIENLKSDNERYFELNFIGQYPEEKKILRKYIALSETDIMYGDELVKTGMEKPRSGLCRLFSLIAGPVV